MRTTKHDAVRRESAIERSTTLAGVVHDTVAPAIARIRTGTPANVLEPTGGPFAQDAAGIAADASLPDSIQRILSRTSLHLPGAAPRPLAPVQPMRQAEPNSSGMHGHPAQDVAPAERIDGSAPATQPDSGDAGHDVFPASATSEEDRARNHHDGRADRQVAFAVGVAVETQVATEETGSATSADAGTAFATAPESSAPEVPAASGHASADATGDVAAGEPVAGPDPGTAADASSPDAADASPDPDAAAQPSDPAAASDVARHLVELAAPALASGDAKLRRLGRNERTHDTAAEKRQQAENAVVVPASEQQSKGNAGQIAAVDKRPAPQVDDQAAKRKLQESLARHVPRTIEDVDNFKRDRKGQTIGADVLAVVRQEKNAVISTFSDMEKTPDPVPPERAPEALPAEEKAPATAPMRLGHGAVAPLLPEHTDVGAHPRATDAMLREEGISQEQLDLVDDGDLAVANQERKDLQQAARTEPQAARDFARQETEAVAHDLSQEEARERGSMQAVRKSGLGATRKKQEGTRSTLEKQREEVATKVNGIFQAAQASVKAKLSDLETRAMQRFDDGNAAATRDFEDTVKREMDAYKADRYSGTFGWTKKAKDWLLGLDDLPGVKAIFQRNRNAFVSRIETLVEDITRDNKRVIQDCKDELARARGEIAAYVERLGPALKDVGEKASREVGDKLDEMDGFIRERERQLQQKLADRQQAAIQAIDEKIEKMKAEMAGAVARIGKLLLQAAKKFFRWALGKFGYSLEDIEGVINKGAAVLKAIFTQPIPFVKNLVRAAITGFRNFGTNFLSHLKDAVFDWLTGALDGIRLPGTWDLKGIASVALQVVGLTWARIRGKLAALIGEPAVKALETGFELVSTLVRDGPMAAWEKIREMAAELKQTFVESIQEFILTRIVRKAVETVVAMFTPGAGIVRAIVGIYDSVVFFVQKARQILQMAGRFLASIGAIAAGNISAAADALENGLATGLKLVINFLAKLLRLDGISKKIRETVQKVQAKVDAMLDKVVKWIAEKARQLFGKVKSTAKSLLQWWKKKTPFKGGGKSHTLLFEGEMQNARLMVRSDPMTPEQFIVAYAPQSISHPKAKSISTLHKKINAIKARIIEAQSKKPPDEASLAHLDKSLTEVFNKLGTELAQLLDLSADEGSEKRPVPIEYPKRRAAAYPTIYVGPMTSLHIRQDQLKDAARAGSRKAARERLFNLVPGLASDELAKNWTGDVWFFSAGSGPSQKLPNGEVVGLSPSFASLAPGMTLVYVEKGKTGGGSKINDRFKPFGFRPRDESLDGDHVMERQLGGPDSVENLWPLHQGENRSSGAMVKSMPVEFSNQRMTVHAARELLQKSEGRAKQALHLLIAKVKG